MPVLGETGMQTDIVAVKYFHVWEHKVDQLPTYYTKKAHTQMHASYNVTFFLFCPKNCSSMGSPKTPTLYIPYQLVHSSISAPI
jgi:hypothetical protein